MFRKILAFLISAFCLLSSFSICSFAEESDDVNYIVNGDFEDMDSSPDYAPNNWTVKKGWFIEAMPGKAANGEGYMVAVQGAEAYQNISGLPSGKYTLSAYIAPLLNADYITVKISSGENEAEITVTYEDMCDYYEINGFEITNGEAVISLLYAAFEDCDFNSTAIVDDMVLMPEPEPTPIPEATASPEPTEAPSEEPSDEITQAPAESSDEPVPSSGTDTVKESKSGSVLPVISIVAVLTAAAVIAIIFIRKKKK